MKNIVTNAELILQKAIKNGYSPKERQDYHFHNQEGNLTSYAISCRKELASIYTNCKKVYLDMKYWIFLREIAYNEVIDQDKQRFYDNFTELFERGELISPLSIAHLSELEKIEDLEKKKNTIQIMDKYSKGLCILFYFDCLTEELASFFINNNIKDTDINWSVYYLDRIARIVGTPKPVHSGLSEKDNIRNQKSFYDLQSYIDVIDFIDMMKDHHNVREATEKLAKQHNFRKGNNKYKDFQDALLTEVNGMLDASDTFILNAYHFSTNSIEELTKEQIQLLKNLIGNSFKYQEEETSKYLPTIYINSCINAYFMFRSEEKYNGNDIDDIWHAAISIPYCDYLLTEKKLSNIINYDSQIRIKKYFKAKVLYSLKSANKLLTGLCEKSEI